MKPVRLFCALALLPFAVAAGQPSLSIRDAWVRAAPPGVAMLAGYGQIINEGAQPRILVAVESPDFASVSVHESFVENGLSKMRPAGKLTIPAGERLVLAPGGYHLMLMHPHAALHAGDTVQLRFRFASGDVLDIAAPVRRSAAVKPQ